MMKEATESSNSTCANINSLLHSVSLRKNEKIITYNSVSERADAASEPVDAKYYIFSRLFFSYVYVVLRRDNSLKLKIGLRQ